MKKVYLFLVFWLTTVTITYAQRGEPVHPQKDKVNYQGFTIRLVPLAENTYGYEIIRGKELLVMQMSNPFTQSLVGIKVKADTYNIAMWHVRQLLQEENQDQKTKGKGEKRPKGVRLNDPIPMNIAKELNIKVD